MEGRPRFVIVADTSPLVFLSRLDRLPLAVALYGTLEVPEEVFHEATRLPDLPGAREVREAREAGRLNVVPVPPGDLRDAMRERLDPGEADAIALARLRGGVVLIDEKKGRAAARSLGLRTTGLLGLLALGAREGLVADPALELEKLVAMGFHLSPSLRRQVLSLAAGEAPG